MKQIFTSIPVHSRLVLLLLFRRSDLPAPSKTSVVRQKSPMAIPPRRTPHPLFVVSAEIANTIWGFLVSFDHPLQWLSCSFPRILPSGLSYPLRRFSPSCPTVRQGAKDENPHRLDHTMVLSIAVESVGEPFLRVGDIRAVSSGRNSESITNSALSRYSAIIDLFSAHIAGEFSIASLTSAYCSFYRNSRLAAAAILRPSSWLAFPYDNFGFLSTSGLLSDDFSTVFGILTKFSQPTDCLSSSDNFVFLACLHIAKNSKIPARFTWFVVLLG